MSYPTVIVDVSRKYLGLTALKLRIDTTVHMHALQTISTKTFIVVIVDAHGREKSLSIRDVVHIARLCD